MREVDIMYEGTRYWVGRDREYKGYIVYKNEAHYSVSHSAYSMDDDGLSMALIMAKYLEDNT